jgi:hypothetical protein
MLAGAYTLDLYCDNPDCPDDRGNPWQYFAELGTTARREARDAGWIITPDKQICPKCSGKKKKRHKLSKGSMASDKMIAELIADGAEAVSVTEIWRRSKMKLP